MCKGRDLVVLAECWQSKQVALISVVRRRGAAASHSHVADGTEKPQHQNDHEHQSEDTAQAASAIAAASEIASLLPTSEAVL
jgi:hypothetical protein